MQAYTIKTVQNQSVVELVERDEPALGPVSYTHLTLPTIYSV